MKISPHGHGDQAFAMIVLFLSQKMAEVYDRFDIPPYIYEAGKILRKRWNPGYSARGEYFPDIPSVKSIQVYTAHEDDDLDPLFLNIDDLFCTLPFFEFAQDQFAFQLFFAIRHTQFLLAGFITLHHSDNIGRLKEKTLPFPGLLSTHIFPL